MIFLLKLLSHQSTYNIFSAERQDVTLYDVLTIDPATDLYKGFAIATLKSSASTTYMAGKFAVDKEDVQVCLGYYFYLATLVISVFCSHQE